MMIETLLNQACRRLASVSDSAQLDAQLLLADVLDVSTAYFYTWPDKLVPAKSADQFECYVTRREQGEPIAYILGRQDFWTLTLEVAPCTLIPRADTERLVEVALELASDAKSILDLGTGTGAIALALAKELPEAAVQGLDFQTEAVQLARRNATRNNIQNINFVQSDWFNSLSSASKFELIVSNPPYIDPHDHHLEQGDVRFEPKTALVAENQGLADIDHIIKQAVSFLAPKGWLMFEHGFDQGAAVRTRFCNQGYTNVMTYQDFGSNDRVTVGQYRF